MKTRQLIVFMPCVCLCLKVWWKVEKQISKFGEDLVLLCEPDGYEISSEKSKRWYGGPEQKLLTLNEGPENSTKYIAIIGSNGFKLIIKNLTKNDVNVEYQCDYGFSRSGKVLLQIDDVFKGLQGHKEMKTNYIVIILTISAVLVALTVVIVMVCRRKQLLRSDTNGPNASIMFPLVPPDLTENGNVNQNKRIISETANGPNAIILLPLFSHDFTENGNVNQNGRIISEKVSQNKPTFVLCTYEVLGDPVEQHQQGVEEMEIKHIKRALQQPEVAGPRCAPFVVPEDLHEVLKYPSYSDIDKRISSFNKKWSLSKPTKEQMWNAGFFFSGIRTFAQCHSCGFRQKWVENQDPMSNDFHEKNCRYLHQFSDQTISV